MSVEIDFKHFIYTLARKCEIIRQKLHQNHYSGSAIHYIQIKLTLPNYIYIYTPIYRNIRIRIIEFILNKQWFFFTILICLSYL